MEAEKHIWSRDQTAALISTYRDNIQEFRNPFKRQKILWENVAYKMKICGFKNITGNNCDRKWRNLKATFKKIYYDTGRTEESKCQWEFYNDLLVLFTKDFRKEMGVERKSRTIEPVVENVNNFEIKYDSISENEEYLDEYFSEIEEIVENETETELELEEEYLNEEELDEEVENDQKFHIQHNEEVATTDETIKEIKEVTEVPAPIWFTNFLTRYETDQSDLKTCMNNILETEKQQMKLMTEIYEKMDKRKCDCESIRKRKKFDHHNNQTNQ